MNTDAPKPLDAIDRRILRVLQEEGRIQNVDLAERVGLSPSPCLRRVKNLEESGVIERYAAQLSPPKLGIVECHLMAGDCDFLLRVVAADLDAYRRFQGEHLTRIAGVQSVKTEIPMQKIKSTSALPI
jgi:Lrp/AsnC family leucine-responsive transcriptional regulator